MRDRESAKKRMILRLGAASLALGLNAMAAGEPDLGATRVAKWRGDQAAAFVLMFDDSWPSHFQVAVPALAERQMTATFYINPGKGEYKAFSNEWEKVVWRQGVVYGNHTYAWVLTAVRRFHTPVRYRHPSGAVIWVKLTSRVTTKVGR